MINIYVIFWIVATAEKSSKQFACECNKVVYGNWQLSFCWLKKKKKKKKKKTLNIHNSRLSLGGGRSNTI